MFVTLIEGQWVPPGTQRRVENVSTFGKPSIFRVSQELRPTRVVNASTFGADTVKDILTATALVNANSFGASYIYGKLGPHVWTNAQTFGAQTIFNKGTLSPSCVVNAQTFGAQKVKAVISDHAWSNAQAFGAPRIWNVGQLNIYVWSNVQTFGTQAAKPKPAEHVFTNPNTFGSPAIGLKPNIYQHSFTNPSGFGGHKISRKLAQTNWSNAQTFGAQSISNVAPTALLEVPFTAPPLASTWTTLGGTTVKSNITIGGSKGVRVQTSGVVGPQAVFKTKPTGTKWTVTARLRRQLPMATGGHTYGVMLRESATGRTQMFGWTPAGFGDVRFGASRFSDNWAGGGSGDYDDWDAWFRVKRVAGNKYEYYVSQDGDYWSQVQNYAVTAPGFAVEADQVGFGVDTPLANSVIIDCFSWDLRSDDAPAVVQAKAFNSSHANFTLDAAPTPGNWLIVFWTIFPTAGAQSGFTEYLDIGGPIYAPDIEIFYRQVQSGDSATQSPGGATGTGRGVVFEVSGLGNTWSAIPQQEHHAFSNGGGGNSVASNNCTSNNTLVLGFCGSDATLGTDGISSAGWTIDAQLSPGPRGAIAAHKSLANNGDASGALTNSGSMVVSSLCTLFLNPG